MADLPWGKCEPEVLDPDRAQNVLDKDHFGLDTVKKRIV
jgi:ATP-dependent Lon protease